MKELQKDILNCETLFKDFINHILKYRKGYYLIDKMKSYCYFNNYYFLILEVWSLSADGK